MGSIVRYNWAWEDGFRAAKSGVYPENTCPRCGTALEVGAYPFCKGDPADHAPGSTGIEDVTWPGGKVFENLGDQLVRCDSPADLKREMKKRNLEPFVRHQDGDRHVARWSAMSAETLAGAAAMLERIGKEKSTQTAVPDYITSMTVTVTEEAGTVSAPRGTFGPR